MSMPKNKKIRKGEEKMKNANVRKMIRAANLSHWQVAEALGVSEFTFCRWLRKEFSAEQIEDVKTAIEKAKEEKHEQ